MVFSEKSVDQNIFPKGTGNSSMRSTVKSHYYLPLKKSVTCFLANLNPLHLRILCAKFDWNWPCGFREKSFECPFKQWYEIALSLVETGQLCDSGENIHKCRQCFSVFRCNLLLEKGGPSFEQTWIPWCFAPSLVEIGQRY